ncbi:MAG: SDR family oxidoreductase [Pseudomonadota bacterium]
MAKYVVIGGSRGIGAATAEHLVEQGHEVLSVSRTPAAAGEWVEADVATDAGVLAVRAALEARDQGNGAAAGLDGLLFLGGVWEKGAFTENYDFFASPMEETRFVLSVNLTAPILLAQALTPYLAKASNPRVILNGSESGLANSGSCEVANTASKFGMQGMTEALNQVLRGHGIGVTVVNFGNVATPEVLDDIETGLFGPQVPIPIEDLLATYDYLLKISAATVPQSIDLRQKTPGGIGE